MVYFVPTNIYLHSLFYNLLLLKTKLDQQRRDITLPTKVHLVKAMVLPVVMYGCESWTVKKAECQRKLSAKELMLLNCGVGEDS